MKIRYYGHVGSLSGYGRAAADNCMALLATGQVDLEIRPLGWNPDEAKIALAHRSVLTECVRQDPDLTPPDIAIVHTLPMDCMRVYGLACEIHGNVDERLIATPWVAYTTWEAVSKIPESMAIDLDTFDQIWVPSSVTLAAVESPKKVVRVIPHAFDPETLALRRPGLPRGDRFRFYWIGSWTSRKNPAGILRAWAMAFTPDDPVELVMHSPGALEPFAIALHQTGLGAKEMAPVRLTKDTLDEATIWRMHDQGDCFVTSARGEAFNLPCFDAMLAGRHIIAPEGQGSDDYLGNTSAERYRTFPAPAGVDVRVTERMADSLKLQMVGAQGLSSRSTWLEPDLCDLARRMVDTAKNKRRHLEVNVPLADLYGYVQVGHLMLKNLEEL